MQLVAVTTSDVGENGNDVFFLRRFVDDHLFFQRVQMLHQQLVGDIHRTCAAHVVHRSLNNMFTVFSYVQHAAIGQYGFHARNRSRLNLGALHTQLC